MTALSKVKTVLQVEFGDSGKEIERRLAARGYCIARIDWVQEAADVMDHWQATQHERRYDTRDAGRGAIPTRPTGTGDRRLPESLRVRRDGDGDRTAVGASVEDLRLGADGGAA